MKTLERLDRIKPDIDAMRIGISILSSFMLTACQTTAEHACFRAGYKDNTPEFRDCVATQRADGHMRMKETAGRGSLQRSGDWR